MHNYKKLSMKKIVDEEEPSPEQIWRDDWFATKSVLVLMFILAMLHLLMTRGGISKYLYLVMFISSIVYLIYSFKKARRNNK